MGLLVLSWNRYKMARKRMFNNEIVSSDKFLDMAISTQCLYFHLCMNADDDWFVSPKRVMRMIWSTDDELKILAMKWFILLFNDWVIVITHRKLNNNEIKLDRYKKTIHQEHLATLSQFNKVYALELGGVQSVAQMEDQSRVDKNRINNKYVKLSEEEYKKLTDRFWESIVIDFIEKIENRITNKKKWKSPYTDYYMTIINRIKRDNPPKKFTDEQIGIIMLNDKNPKNTKIITELKKTYTDKQLKDLLALYLNWLVNGWWK